MSTSVQELEDKIKLLHSQLDQCRQDRRALRARIIQLIDGVSEAIFDGKKRKETDSMFGVEE